jgi:FMN phosphatase YigB (HAD superfamily)
MRTKAKVGDWVFYSADTTDWYDKLPSYGVAKVTAINKPSANDKLEYHFNIETVTTFVYASEIIGVIKEDNKLFQLVIDQYD